MSCPVCMNLKDHISRWPVLLWNRLQPARLHGCVSCLEEDYLMSYNYLVNAFSLLLLFPSQTKTVQISLQLVFLSLEENASQPEWFFELSLRIGVRKTNSSITQMELQAQHIETLIPLRKNADFKWIAIGSSVVTSIMVRGLICYLLYYP